MIKSYLVFLSTPSVRRATIKLHNDFRHFDISIHALREEGDAIQRTGSVQIVNFYPRPP